jgi:crossover junction endodeoxyribonuclease RuvC
MPTMQRGVTSKKQAVNAAELAKLVRELAPEVVVVELVQAMPRNGDTGHGMGAASAFNFGETAGVIRGVIAALELECHYVTPQSWKKRAGLSGSDKEASRARAIHLWPIAPLALKKHQGRAESLLIARFGAPGIVAAAVDPFNLHAEPEPSPAAPQELTLV